MTQEPLTQQTTLHKAPHEAAGIDDALEFEMSFGHHKTAPTHTNNLLAMIQLPASSRAHDKGDVTKGAHLNVDDSEGASTRVSFSNDGLATKDEPHQLSDEKTQNNNDTPPIKLHEGFASKPGIAALGVPSLTRF